MTDKAWFWWACLFATLLALGFDRVLESRRGDVLIMAVVFLATASIHDAIAKLKGPTQ